MTDYILDDCTICGRVTDWRDDIKSPPICVVCSDKGATLNHSKVRAARIMEARTRKANGETIESIMASMNISRQTLWRWLHKNGGQHGTIGTDK